MAGWVTKDEQKWFDDRQAAYNAESSKKKGKNLKGWVQERMPQFKEEFPCRPKVEWLIAREQAKVKKATGIDPPPFTEEQILAYVAQYEASLHDKISTKFRWPIRRRTKGTEGIGLLFSFLKAAAPARKAQKNETAAKMWGDRLKKLVKAALKADTIRTPGHQLHVRQTTLATMVENLNTVEAKELEDRHETDCTVFDKNIEVMKQLKEDEQFDISPEQQQRIHNDLEAIFRPLFVHLGALLQWSFSLEMGGLDINGEPQTASMHHGLTRDGRNLPETMTDFEREVMAPFTRFIHLVHHDQLYGVAAPVDNSNGPLDIGNQLSTTPGEVSTSSTALHVQQISQPVHSHQIQSPQPVHLQQNQSPQPVHLQQNQYQQEIPSPYISQPVHPQQHIQSHHVPQPVDSQQHIQSHWEDNSQYESNDQGTNPRVPEFNFFDFDLETLGYDSDPCNPPMIQQLQYPHEYPQYSPQYQLPRQHESHAPHVAHSVNGFVFPPEFTYPGAKPVISHSSPANSASSRTPPTPPPSQPGPQAPGEHADATSVDQSLEQTQKRQLVEPESGGDHAKKKGKKRLATVEPESGTTETAPSQQKRHRISTAKAASLAEEKEEKWKKAEAKMNTTKPKPSLHKIAWPPRLATEVAKRPSMQIVWPPCTRRRQILTLNLASCLEMVTYDVAGSLLSPDHVTAISNAIRAIKTLTRVNQREHKFRCNIRALRGVWPPPTMNKRFSSSAKLCLATLSGYQSGQASTENIWPRSVPGAPMRHFISAPGAPSKALEKKRAKDRRFYTRHQEDRKAKSREYYHSIGKHRRRESKAKMVKEHIRQAVLSLTDEELLQLRPNLIPATVSEPDTSGPDHLTQRQRAQREIVQIYKKQIDRLEGKVDVWESKWGGTDTWTARATDFDVDELNPRDRREFEDHILEGSNLADEIQEIWRSFDIPADARKRHALISRTMNLHGLVIKGIGKLTEMPHRSFIRLPWALPAIERVITANISLPPTIQLVEDQEDLDMHFLAPQTAYNMPVDTTKMFQHNRRIISTAVISSFESVPQYEPRPKMNIYFRIFVAQDLHYLLGRVP
ncbi:hypothetical protein C8J56DRAFT_898263 [Mycena floridula]|nr:hypothetical protein C8J56DRAFT_898263 [Mycena floridula]